MRFLMALGVIVWILIIVWMVRLWMGLEHLSNDQIPIMIVCGAVGGFAGWYVVSRHAQKLEAERKRS